MPGFFFATLFANSFLRTQHCAVSLPLHQGLAQFSPCTVLTPRLCHSLPIVRPVPGQRTPPIKTQARGATILPNFVGLKFQVHNGKIYHDVTITEEMVGHKLGEFSPLVYLLFI